MKYYQYYKYLFLLILLIASWFSIGWFHGDEHWQLLEFANYKLGNSPQKDLPWEYSSELRPGFQVLIVWVTAKIFLAFNFYQPFYVAFILRFCTACLSWYASLLVIKMLQNDNNYSATNLWIMFFSFAIWFIPYQHVRFCSENVSAILFIFGLYFVCHQSKKMHHYALGGLLLGLAFETRYQIAFAIIGMCLWILFYTKFDIKKWLLMIFGGIVALAIGTIIDAWLYDKWVFVPYNYFKFNIIDKGANNWGEQPWYWYLTEFFNLGIPPISILLLIITGVGLYIGRKKLFSWIFIVFLVGHIAVSHKELRFISPLLYFVPALLIYGYAVFDGLFTKYRLIRISFIATFYINIILLPVGIFKSADFQANFYSHLYNSKIRTIIYSNTDPYHDVVKQNFYKPPYLKTQKINLKDISNYKGFIYFSNQPIPTPLNDKVKLTKVYSTLPDFFYYFNVNNWISRVSAWNLYVIE